MQTQKMADKNIKHHADILNSIIESSFDGLWICDAEGNVLKINRASERINEIKAEDVLGRNVSELVDEGLFDESVTLEVIKKKKPATIMQNLKSGKQLLVTGNPIFIDGNLRYIVTNDRDITELMRLKRELDESREITKRYYTKLQESLDARGNDQLVFCSKEMKTVFETIRKVSEVDVTVFLQGESGVGKNHVARMIHKYSDRSDYPFIQVNCGAIPDNLLESELFGYVGGAFTGARKEGKAGIFEMAHHGTLFLDEIAEMPLNLQVKLLDFLDTGKMKRVGDTISREIDVRIIAASNRNVEEYVKEKKFRKDLYFRLNIVPITIPPLRERRDDIPLLMAHFLKIFNKKHKKNLSISTYIIDTLYNYHFPGNVRELSNLVERMVVMAKGSQITKEDIPSYILEDSREDFIPFNDPSSWTKSTLGEMIEKLEQEIFGTFLEQAKTQQEMARILGISQPTVARKLKKYNMSHHKKK